MNDLARYVELIVEPTFEDFRKNSTSVRRAFLTCVAIYHAVDRVSYPKKPGNLGKAWGRKSFNFLIVDMIAHHFKHVKSDYEKAPPPKDAIPLSFLVFGKPGDTDEQMELHNLFFVIRDAVQFLKDKAVQAQSTSELYIVFFYKAKTH